MSGFLWFLVVWNVGTWLGACLTYWQWRHRGVGRDFTGAFVLSMFVWPVGIPVSTWLLVKSYQEASRLKAASMDGVARASGRRRSHTSSTMG